MPPKISSSGVSLIYEAACRNININETTEKECCTGPLEYLITLYNL